MFRHNPDVHPISIVITTLAARAYEGESDLGEAMERILAEMGGLIHSARPRVPNPVNPAEDFADKWYTDEGRQKKLENNFFAWLAQAKADLASITESADLDFIGGQSLQKLGASVNPVTLRQKLSLSSLAAVPPRVHVITETPAKPWVK